MVEDSGLRSRRGLRRKIVLLPAALTALAIGSENESGKSVYGASPDQTFHLGATNTFPASGNAGIGTVKPDASLTVFGTKKNFGNKTADFFNTDIGPNSSAIHYGTTGDLLIRSASSSGHVIMQDTGGTIGIGIKSPDKQLTVYGKGASYITVKDGTREPILGADYNNVCIVGTLTNHALDLRTNNVDRVLVNCNEYSSTCALADPMVMSIIAARTTTYADFTLKSSPTHVGIVKN